MGSRRNLNITLIFHVGNLCENGRVLAAFDDLLNYILKFPACNLVEQHDGGRIARSNSEAISDVSNRLIYSKEQSRRTSFFFFELGLSSQC